MRGWLGRGRGYSNYVQQAAEWRGTTVQVCGMWPFAIGTGTPMVGVPLGRHIHTGATLCCDPISWFQRAKLISNPSAFVLGKPGLGKSTIVRRMATGLAGYGVMPLVLGDLKPDYVDLIEALGGQVITLGRGRGYLNILDPGEATEAAARLREAGFEKEAAQVLADAHGRRHTMVSALLTILRSAPPTDREETIIDRALKWLDEHHDGVPVLGDLLRVVQEGPAEVRAVALDRGDDTRYKAITEDLEASLIGLVGGGRLGETFARQTTNPMRRDAPVVYDVSAIDDSEMDLQAATLLACWSAGFGTVNVANALADAGLEPRRHYFVILDELWRALRAGRGMVDRVDALTRLNRQRGVGMAMISHTMSDLLALPTEEDRMKARGFVERSGMVICGGLPSAEMPQLTAAVPFSQAEQDLLIGWQDPPAWDPATGRESEPPGRGKFLVKVGGRPGIPVAVQLTATELSINDTNKLWHERSRVGRRSRRSTREEVTA
ncbi:ATP/GTP-binding protein [Microbacterium sp. NPDC055683]